MSLRENFINTKLKYFFAFLFLIFVIIGCKNPFSPTFDDSDDSSSFSLSDLKSIGGVFQNFQYAYAFKDTIIYGEFISQDFIFTYRDNDQGFDVSWGRDEEMKTTQGLFENSQRLDLIWNNIVLSTEDSLSATIVRGFNLTITLNPTDIIRVDGRVNLSLRRNLQTEKWAITKWLDESNF
ncbi:MAG: hypothetical protein ABI550_08030 [Ignavibacteriaceae bacterium]